jgi:hypothetical protein
MKLHVACTVKPCVTAPRSTAFAVLLSWAYRSSDWESRYGFR